MKIGFTRAISGFLLVLATALVLRALLPTYSTVPSTLVMFLVAAFAAVIAYLMSYTAVLKTGRVVKASGRPQATNS